jgi:hypothetical protein
MADRALIANLIVAITIVGFSQNFFVQATLCVCETYIGKPFGTRVVPQFTTEVAKPLTQ